MRTRFAPSPTGPLHLGHAFSAILAHDRARQAGGTFLLRIEDIDAERCRPEWEAQILDDLGWLGLDWERPVLRQSDNLPAYRTALTRLAETGVVYPCTCRRRDLAQATTAPHGRNPGTGPDGIVYPGTCRPAAATDPRRWPPDAALRLNLTRLDPGLSLGFVETGAGPEGETGRITFTIADAVREIGDFVVARREIGTSYHLSVVVDDAAQNVSEVTRGQDLFDATRIHVILQHLLGLPTPVYHHHRLICDQNGKRLAKRDDARAIGKYRQDGASPQDIRRMVGL